MVDQIRETPNERPIARLTVTQSIYHQVLTDDPIRIESRFSRDLHLREQPYIRRARVGRDAIRIDYGWLSGTSQLCITNTHGESFPSRLTAIEKAVRDSRVLHCWILLDEEDTLGLAGIRPHIIIRPGQSARFEPGPGSSIWLASGKQDDQDTSYSVTVIPE